jgi:hypothetical protein
MVAVRAAPSGENASVGDGTVPSLPDGVRAFGIVSSGLVAAWTIWFMVAFVPWISALPSWSSISSFADSFQAGPYLAWAIPCLLLALTFPVLMWSIHHMVDPERRFWTGLGVIFGALYGGILGSVYWIIVTVVPARIASGDLSGLAPLVVVSPHSTANALEGLGYGLMGLATMAAGWGFPRGRWTTWIRALLVTNGVSGLLGFVFVVAGLLVPGMVALVAWSVTLPLGCAAIVGYLVRRTAVTAYRPAAGTVRTLS